MTHIKQSAVRRAQKESLILRELSQLYARIVADDQRLQGLTISRVKLSPDKSVCRVFLFTPESHEIFQEKLGILILYKPSLRKALASSIDARHVPNIIFAFDDMLEKQQRIDTLLEKVKESRD